MFNSKPDKIQFTDYFLTMAAGDFYNQPKDTVS